VWRDDIGAGAPPGAAFPYKKDGICSSGILKRTTRKDKDPAAWA